MLATAKDPLNLALGNGFFNFYSNNTSMFLTNENKFPISLDFSCLTTKTVTNSFFYACQLNGNKTGSK